MLIRKPCQEVFEALVNPAITKHFWFSRGSDRLDRAVKVTWEWEVSQFSVPVVVGEITPGKKIIFQWGEPAKTVVFAFEALTPEQTYVTATESGYTTIGNALLREIRDSTGGFTTVLDGMKAFLEHGISLNLIADKFPPQIMPHGK